LGLIVTSAVRHEAFCDVGLIVTSAVRHGAYCDGLLWRRYPSYLLASFNLRSLCIDVGDLKFGRKFKICIFACLIMLQKICWKYAEVPLLKSLLVTSPLPRTPTRYQTSPDLKPLGRAKRWRNKWTTLIWNVEYSSQTSKFKGLYFSFHFCWEGPRFTPI